jgi:hypothetical protein
MVDLAALQKAAAKSDTAEAVVSRRWLAEVAREIAACRARQRSSTQARA